MLGINRATDLATSLLHVLSGLYTTFQHASSNDASGALTIALVTGLGVIIIALAFAAAEMVKVRARRYARKHELESRTPDRRDKGD